MMDPRPTVAPPQGLGPFSCRICGCEVPDRRAFNEHHRTPWHLYNMRRQSQQLPVVTISEFERKIELLRLARQYAEGEGPMGTFQPSSVGEGPQESPALGSTAAEFRAAVRCNKKGMDHLKRHISQQQQQPEDDNTETATAADKRTAAAKAAAAAWRAALQQHPERCNLFEQMPAFASAAENLKYMNRTYGFFVCQEAPARATDVVAAVVFVAAVACGASIARFRRRRCCFWPIPDEEYCVNVAGLLRCLWREQQQEPRCLFCCKRFRGLRAALQHMQQQRHFQLKWDEEQQDLLHRFYDYRKSYYQLLERLNGPNARQLQADESGSDASAERDVPAGAAAGTETPEMPVDEESMWEDYSSDDGDERTGASEQQKLEEILKARGWRYARVTDDGHLQLPNGQEVLHRSHAVFCRQRLRRLGPHLAEQCVLQDMAGISSQHALAKQKCSLAFCKLQKLQRERGILRSDRCLQQQQRLLLPLQQRRLLWRREAEEQRRRQHQRMKLGIKASTLQRTILRETKFFL
ncbi:hypothetical protein, conserved [Eimeria praecox]|uniref:C2H2-type domain-containing protein n=1 Tax=Eimeria praecox TaxID=51316 RepID=U6H9R9_9EIME|nr:hypothetical protein, conserved [Eimeria praecox]